jgi:hypothetical protein
LDEAGAHPFRNLEQRGHGHGTGATRGSIKWWEEFDVIPGFSVKFAQRFTLNATYDYYASPAGRYNYGNHLNNWLSFDDTDLLIQNFALLPRFTFLYELPGAVPTGIKGNGWYFSPSLEPSYTFFSDTSHTFTFSVPIGSDWGTDFMRVQIMGILTWDRN